MLSSSGFIEFRLGLPYVLLSENMSSFSTKKQLSSEDAKEIFLCSENMVTLV